MLSAQLVLVRLENEVSANEATSIDSSSHPPTHQPTQLQATPHSNRPDFSFHPPTLDSSFRSRAQRENPYQQQHGDIESLAPSVMALRPNMGISAARTQSLAPIRSPQLRTPTHYLRSLARRSKNVNRQASFAIPILFSRIACTYG